MTDITVPAATSLHFLKNQPRGLGVLFFTEMWERFSYYGMRSLLIFYLTEHFKFSDAESYAIYGSYTALVYMSPLIGGLIADRLIGTRRAVALGAVLLAFGHFTMAIEGPPAQVLLDGDTRTVLRDGLMLQTFYLALALIIAGEAFLKANISTMVGRLYAPGDPRRDTGFTLFYLGINLGAFAATLLCGYLGQKYGWRYGFGLAGIGMLVGLVVFWRGTRALAGIGDPPEGRTPTSPLLGPLNVQHTVYLAAAGIIVSAWALLHSPFFVSGALGAFCIAAALALLGYGIAFCPREVRDRLIVALILMVFTVVFWALFEQGGSSLSLFTARNVDRHVLGFTLQAAQLPSLNPFFIMVLAVPFAWLWHRQAEGGRPLATPYKFALGIAQAGLGFFVLVWGAKVAGANAQVPLIFLVVAYFIHTTGELCLSPIGLSAVTKLAPPQIVGFTMGAAFLSVAAAQLIAARLAQTAALAPVGSSGMGLSAGLEAYMNLFNLLGWIAVIAAVLLTVLSPLLNRMMHGLR